MDPADPADPARAVGAFFDWCAEVPGLGCAVSCCVMRGRPPYQEDRTAVEFDAGIGALAAVVVDGHGGSATADLVGARLCGDVLRARARGEPPGAALRSAILQLDRSAMRERHASDTSGACLAAALLSADGSLALANLGDCEVLCGFADGRAPAVLSRAHSVDADMPRLRCVRATIERDTPRSESRLVSGGFSLAVARAMGDFFAKKGDIESHFEVSREPFVAVAPAGACWLALVSDGTLAGASAKKVATRISALSSVLTSRGQRSNVPFFVCAEAILQRRGRDNASCVFFDLRARGALAARGDQSDVPALAQLCETRLACDSARRDALEAHAVANRPHRRSDGAAGAADDDVKGTE